jgi:hypothetical protein
MEHYLFSGSGVRRLFFREVSTIHRGRDRILREMRTNERTALLVRSVRKRAEAIASARIAVATDSEATPSQIGGSKL